MHSKNTLSEGSPNKPRTLKSSTSLFLSYLNLFKEPVRSCTSFLGSFGLQLTFV